MTRSDDDNRLREEVERRRRVRRETTVQIPADERARAQALHFMRCPKCGSQLDEITFRGVKVDKCFECGGVYLDDGELEQLAGKPGWFEAMRLFFSGR